MGFHKRDRTTKRNSYANQKEAAADDSLPSSCSSVHRGRRKLLASSLGLAAWGLCPGLIPGSLFRESQAATTISTVYYVPLYDSDFRFSNTNTLAINGPAVVSRNSQTAQHPIIFAGKDYDVPLRQAGERRLVILHHHGTSKYVCVDDAVSMYMVFAARRGEIEADGLAGILTELEATQAVLLSCNSADLAKDVAKRMGITVSGSSVPFDSTVDGELIDRSSVAARRGREVLLKTPFDSVHGTRTLAQIVSDFVANT